MYGCKTKKQELAPSHPTRPNSSLLVVDSVKSTQEFPLITWDINCSSCQTKMDQPSLVNSSATMTSVSAGLAALREASGGYEPATADSCKGGSVRVVSGSGFRYVVPFPWRLHQMLEDIEKLHEESIVSWLPDGRHFQVHNPQVFMQKIIPKFFKQKSYKSFQRQLHLYGFQRVLDGPCRGKLVRLSAFRSSN